MQLLGWHDRQKVYQALVSGLHGLRDSLPRDEAIYLGAGLPILLRGLYYEGWHPTGRPLKSRNDFLDRLHDGLHRDAGISPEQVACAILALLGNRLPPPKPRMPGPPRRNRSGSYGQAEFSAMVHGEPRRRRDYVGCGIWDGGLSEAEMIDDTAVGTALMGDTDLHDHLMKALYELKKA